MKLGQLENMRQGRSAMVRERPTSKRTSAVEGKVLCLDEVVLSLQTAGWQALRLKKRRCVCSGIVKSASNTSVCYPMVLDMMEDGIFAAATYPSKIRRSSYPQVFKLLNERNYTARYGKYVMDTGTGELKFRVFRSVADVCFDRGKTVSLLTSLPARMLDMLSEELAVCEEGSGKVRVSLGRNSSGVVKMAKNGVKMAKNGASVKKIKGITRK